MVEEEFSQQNVDRHEIKVNPVGVNHFTWLTEASWRNIDLFPYYEKFCDKHHSRSHGDEPADQNWMNRSFASKEQVKMDLFRRFGYIAAAGDRHLAEFCEGKWYLESPQRVAEMGFELTPVSWRKQDLHERLKSSENMISGKEAVTVGTTGEEGVNQIRALLGLTELVTNVNLPNQGQIPNLPLGAVVETNAVFRANSLWPVMAGAIPATIYPLIVRICTEQENVSRGIELRDRKLLLSAFSNDPLVTCDITSAEKLFDEMCMNTAKYLTMYPFCCK